ncbi:hypothetical protein CRYUN_Cryun13aG0102100 [Craigia yunnanensis]
MAKLSLGPTFSIPLSHHNRPPVTARHAETASSKLSTPPSAYPTTLSPLSPGTATSRPSSPPSSAPFPKSDYAGSASESRTAALSPSTGSPATRATFFLILQSLMPGLTGGSKNSYVRHMLTKAKSKGWRVVVFTNRGCGDNPVTTPQHLGLATGDTYEVVEHVGARYREPNLYAVGLSLGANILVRYLDHSKFCSDRLQLVYPSVWNLILALFLVLCHCVILSIWSFLMRNYTRALTMFDKALARSICKIFKKDFDEGLTRVSFGFKSVDGYYPNASSCYSIKHVQTPLLCIQTANDPIAPSRAIPREDIKENPNCMLIVTPKGGHLGWVTGVEAPLGAPWSDCVVMNFLEHLERGALKTAGFSCDSEAVQHSSKGLHRIEVQQANY